MATVYIFIIMLTVLIRASYFVAIILLGFFLRKVGFFKDEDFKTISKILINITISATVVVNFAGRTLDSKLLIFIVFGFLFFGPLLSLVYFLVFHRAGKEDQSFAICSASGCNIGGFGLPFVQAFLGPEAVMMLSVFDLGNGYITNGGAYAVASSIKHGEKIRLLPIVKKVMTRPPIISFSIVILLSLFNVQLPDEFVDFASVIANANTFMAMMMIGVGIHFDEKNGQFLRIAKILSIRYVFAIALCLLIWFVIPFPANWKKVLIILCICPLSGASPAYTAQLKADYGCASAMNSISIIISVVLITAVLTLF